MFALLQVYKCLELFVSEPTYVSTHIVNQEKAQFPAITICPISKGYKEDVLQVKGKKHTFCFCFTIVQSQIAFERAHLSERRGFFYRSFKGDPFNVYYSFCRLDKN